MLEDVKTKLTEDNKKYKQIANEKRRFKEFQVGDLVMVHLWKERCPTVTYSKLKPLKLGHFIISKKINTNVYAIVLQSDLNISPTFNISNIYEYHPLNNISITELEMSSSNTRGHMVQP